MEVGELFAKLTLDQAEFDSQMSSARDKMNSFGDSAIKTGGMLSAGLTLPLVGVGVSAINMAADYESGMNILQAVSGATGDQMSTLGDLALDLGNDIELPGTSASDAAEAMIELSKAGLSINDVMGAAKGVLQASAAGQISNAEAAELTANALNTFGLKGSEASRIADLLAAAANASSSEMSDLGMGIAQSGAVAAQMGVPIEDLTTAIAEMSNAGIAGSDAGTSLKTMMLRLAAPTDKAKGLMDDLGIAVYDANGQFKSFPELADEFTRATAGMSDEQRNAAFSTLFGTDAIRAANIVLGQGSDKFNELKGAVTEQGAAGEMAAAQMKGLNGAIEALKGALETLLIQVGLPFLTFLAGLVVKLAGFLEKIGEVSPKVRNAALAFAGVLAAAGPTILVLGTLAKALAFILSPLGLVVIAIGLLAAAFATDFMGIRTITISVITDTLLPALNRLSDWFTGTATPAIKAFAADARSFFSGTIQPAITGFVDNALPRLEQFGNWFTGTALPAIRDFGTQAAAFFIDTILPAVGGFVDTVLPKLQQFGDWFTTIAIPAVSNFATQVATFFTGTVLPAVNTFVDTVLPKLQQFGDWIVLTAIPAVLGLRDNLVNGFITIQTAVVAALTTLWPYLQAVFNGIREAATAIIPQLMVIWAQLSAQFTAASPLIQNLTALFNQLRPVLVTIATIIGVTLVVAIGVVMGVLSGLAGFLGGALPGAFQALAGVIQVVTGIIQVFTSVITGLVAIVSALIQGDWSAAWQAFKDMVQGAADGVRDIVQGLEKTITGIISGLVKGVLGFISGLVDGVVEYFKGLYNTLVGNSIIPDLVNGILDWIGKLPTEVLQLITDFVSGAVEQFGELLTTGTEKITGLYDAVTEKISSLATDALETVTGWVGDVVQGFTDLVTDATEQAQSLYDDVTELVGDLATDALETVTTMASDVVEEFSGLVTDAVAEVGKLPSKITSTLGDLSTLLFDAGASVIGGLIDGVESKIEALKETFKGITGLIPDWKGPESKDKKLLTPAGEAIMGGLIGGIESGQPQLRDTLHGVTADVKRAIDTGLGMPSYSKVTFEQGRQAMVGFAKGITATGPEAKAAIDEQVAKIKQALMVNVNEMRTEAESQLTELWATAKSRMDAVKAMYEKRAGEIQSAIKAGMDPEAGKAQLADLKEYTDTVLHQIQTKAAEEAAAIRESLETNIADANETAQAQIAEIEASISDGTEAAADATAENSGDMQQSFTESLETMKSEALQRLGELQTIVSEALWGMKPDAIRAGLALGRGFIDGIQHTWPRLRQVGEATAQIVIDAIRSQLDIASPSRVTENQGMMIGRGLVDGLRSMHSLVQRESDRLGMAAMPTIPNLATGRAAIGVGGFDDVYSGGGGIVMHFHGDMNVRNDRDIELIADRVGNVVTSKLRARGQQ